MILPDEILNKQFSSGINGYKKAEVDAYIRELAKGYAELYGVVEAQKKQIAEKDSALIKAFAAAEEKNEELEDLRSSADAVRSALVDSRSAAARIIEEAVKRSEEIEQITKEKCAEVISALREEIRAERDRLNMLRAQVSDFRTRIYEQYQEHISMLERITPQLGEADWDMTAADGTRRVLAMLRGEIERRTRKSEMEEQQLDREIEKEVENLGRVMKENARAAAEAGTAGAAADGGPQENGAQ